MHLGHVRAPQHEGVGILDVVIATHRLVNTEGTHETGNGRSHAVAGVGVEVVGAETGLPQLGGGIAFPDRPLTGTEHADRRSHFIDRLAGVGLHVFLERCLPLFFHDVEGLLPRDRLEIAGLVVLAVLHAQQRLGQAVFAVLDLGQEITLDAVQATVDRCIRITLGGDDTAVLDTHQHRTTGAAETASGLVPADVGRRAGAGALGAGSQRNPGGRCGSGNSLGLQKFTAIHGHGQASSGSSASSQYS